MTTSTKIILSCFALGVFYLFYALYLRGQIYLYKVRKKIKEMERHAFKNISNAGFTIYVDHVPRDIKWRQIRSIEFLDKNTWSLEILLKDAGKIMIMPNCLEKLEFVRKVPEGIDKFDYAYVQQFFGGLKSCKICGCFAIENETCLNCDYSEETKRKRKGERTEEEFYKEEQLDYFTTYFDEQESVEAILQKAKHSEIFKCDPEWKIYPTKAEIQQEQEEMK